MSITYKVSTISEFLEKRYGSPTMKLLSSIAIFIFLVPYSAAVFMGLSYLFTASFPMLEYWHAVVFMGLFTTIYLVMGGYKSMTLIDTIFGMIMTVGVMILVAIALTKGGGLAKITSDLAAFNPKLTEAIGPPGWWPLFCLIFLTSVAPFAMPQLIQKFYAIKDRKSIKMGMVASTFFALLIGGIAYFLGSTTRIFLSPDTTPTAFNSDGKPIVDALMPELLSAIVPESLSIIILLLILSASMSTLASLVLISSSSVTKDFYAGFVNRNVSDQKLTQLMRLGNGFFVLLSVILALLKPDSIVAILAVSWGAIGSIFLGPFVWGLFNKKVGKLSAMSAAGLGLGINLILYFNGFSTPEAGTIGMLVSLTVPLIGLGFAPQPEQKVEVEPVHG